MRLLHGPALISRVRRWRCWLVIFIVAPSTSSVVNSICLFPPLGHITIRHCSIGNRRAGWLTGHLVVALMVRLWIEVFKTYRCRRCCTPKEWKDTDHPGRVESWSGLFSNQMKHSHGSLQDYTSHAFHSMRSERTGVVLVNVQRQNLEERVMVKRKGTDYAVKMASFQPRLD